MLTLQRRRRRGRAVWLAAAALLGGAAAPAPPKRVAGILMPTAPVLADYDKTVAAEKLTIPPVSAGLGTVAELPTLNPLGPQVDVNGYRVQLSELQRFVNALAANGPRPDLVPRVRLEQSARFDFQTPRNEEILITTGALDKLAEGGASEQLFMERVFFLLGHEYAHVLYDHPRRYAKLEKSPELANVFATGLGIFATVNRLSAGQGGAPPISPEVMGGLQFAIEASPAIELELYRAGIAPYRKEQESLCDFASADLLAKMRVGNAREASRALEAFEKYDNSLVAQLKKGLDEIEKRINTNMKAFGDAAPTMLMNRGLETTLNAASASLINAIGSALGDFINNRFNRQKVHLYYSAEKRVEAIGAYVDRFHAGAGVIASDADRAALGEDAPPAETPDQIARRLNVPTQAQFLVSYRRERGPDLAAQKAFELLKQNNPAEARATLDAARKAFEAASASPAPGPAGKAAKGKTAAKGKAKPAAKTSARPSPIIPSVYFHDIDARAYKAQGRFPEAEAALLRALSLPGAPVSAYVSLAMLQSSMGKPAAASATLDRGGAKLGERFFIVEKIRHHGNLGDMARVEKLVAACAAYADLVKDCAAAVPKPAETDKAAAGTT